MKKLLRVSFAFLLLISLIAVTGCASESQTAVPVLPGSGKSMTADALRNGAEVYITGDFGHHDGIDAVDQGLNVIDAGHYGIEHIFIGQMAEELKERFPEMEICTEPIRHPFLMV